MLKVAVIAVSDRAAAGVYDDVSGPTLAQIINRMGAEVVAARLVPDEPEQIQAALRRLADDEDIHLILTTGGTGPAPRDHTPEATKAVIEREMPGLAELLRWDGYRRTPWALLGRGVAGIRGRTLIINLPGNPDAVREGMEALAPILPPTVSLMRGGPFYPDMTAAECCQQEKNQ
ncbi:MAG: MogA/MoaB family molybdenum cofactor biosynthesis protein [Anaerolineae bacterium]